MWRDIALANSDAIVKSIDLFSDNLAQLRKAIVDGNRDELTTRFERAKSARDDFADMLDQQSQVTEK
jgi:prephenate dehydrogenase